MGQYMKSLLLLLMIVSLFEGEKAEIIESGTRVTVQIVDGLSRNQDLTLHCKSKDNDLGQHTIKSPQVYTFSFFPRFIGKTLFFCNFWWSSNTSSHYFNIYDQDRDWCKACTWHISESGVCLENDGLGRKLCYSYNSKP